MSRAPLKRNVSPASRFGGSLMSADSTENHFTFTELVTGDEPEWLKKYLDLPEEEKQSSFVATIQLLPGSDKLEIEEMGGQLAWSHSKLTVEDFAALEALGMRGKLSASGYGCSGDEPFTSRALIVATHQLKESVDLPQPNNCQ